MCCNGASHARQSKRLTEMRRTASRPRSLTGQHSTVERRRYRTGHLPRTSYQTEEANRSQKVMLHRLISRLDQTRLVLGTSLARWLKIVSRTRLRLYQSSLYSTTPVHYGRREHLEPTEAQEEQLERRHWHPPDVTPYWSAKFRAAPDAVAWRFVLYEYERRN